MTSFSRKHQRGMQNLMSRQIYSKSINNSKNKNKQIPNKNFILKTWLVNIIFNLYYIYFSDDMEDESHDDLVESGQAEYEREGKFLLYWKTTTTTSTFTSYTATTTLGALECTPSGFGVSQCPSNGKK